MPDKIIIERANGETFTFNSDKYGVFAIADNNELIKNLIMSCVGDTLEVVWNSLQIASMLSNGVDDIMDSLVKSNAVSSRESTLNLLELAKTKDRASERRYWEAGKENAE